MRNQPGVAAPPRRPHQDDDVVAYDSRSVLGSAAEVAVDLRVEEEPGRPVLRWLARELASPVVFLLPLRLFIGLGWTRAAVEKVADAGWYDGTAVRAFLDGQLETGAIAFPSYAWVSEHLWHALATPLGWLVMLTQMVIGVAILVGSFTNLALLTGLLLNVNFMLAGVITPSAFYIVIQVVLLATGAGAVFGLDHLGRNDDRSAILVAHRDGSLVGRFDRWWIAGLAIFSAVIGLTATERATDFSPTGVNDPALVLAVVMAVCASTLGIVLVRDLVSRSP
jgi:thiosulfate dehydrogenase [quinone] large subunit